jgi:uncharacterized protein YndB with AHSA1/START domain
MTTSTLDRIEKSTVLRAPCSRVWRTLTDPKAFSEWFQVKVEGPFTPGARRSLDRISQQWDEALDRLGLLVED